MAIEIGALKHLRRPRSGVIVQHGCVTHLDIWDSKPDASLVLEVRKLDPGRFSVTARDRQPRSRIGPFNKAVDGLTPGVIDKVTRIFDLTDVTPHNPHPEALGGLEISYEDDQGSTIT